MKCLKDLIEATNLYVNFDDCFKEFNAVLIKVYVGARKPKGGGGAIQENSLTKHKVKYESISKKNMVKTFYQSQIFMKAMRSLR